MPPKKLNGVKKPRVAVQALNPHAEFGTEEKDEIIPAIEEAKKNNSPLPITKIVDGYYEEIQKMGGNRWDTSSLIRRFRKK